METKYISFVIIILLLFAFGCEHSKELIAPQESEVTSIETQKPADRHGVLVLPPSTSSKIYLKKGTSTNQTTSNNYLGDLWRFPAEEKGWLITDVDTVYYRDVLAGVDTYISNASDGETWYAEAILPNGSTEKWDIMTFRSSYGSDYNCFVTPWWKECGTTSILVLWYTEIQCAPTGNWRMNFYNNGNLFATKTFYVKPQIPPGKVPRYNQGSYASIKYDNTNKSIGALGCYLTSCCMVLSYHGITVYPPTLNTWLIDKDGYGLDGDVDPFKVAEYARLASKKSFSFRGKIIIRDDAGLEKLICKYGPQLMGVKLKSNGEPGHWVTAIGRDLAKTTFLINDPTGGIETTIASGYSGKWGHIRIFSGSEYKYEDESGISIRFYSPGELLLTDPQGRRVGRDPIKGIDYNEIPNASYAGEGLIDDTDPNANPETDPSFFKEILILTPIEGDYNLKVIGTENGIYSLRIRAYDLQGSSSGNNFLDISIIPNSIHSYSFNYSKAIGSKTKTFGGFDGGGQRPKDVNKFLSYGNPSESQTTLPSGTTIFPLQIFYGSTIIPNTFKAELNGNDITTLFNPVPEQCQVVNLNLVPGRNVLVLSVDGQLPTRIATDTDRLVFKVQ